MHRTIELPPEPAAARVARHFVAEHLRDSVDGEVAEVAVLLTSELVTNAIVHAGSPLRVEVDIDARTIRVTVVDEVSRPPQQRARHDARLTGRGINLVAALSRGWGVEPAAPGKKVWFELPA